MLVNLTSGQVANSRQVAATRSNVTPGICCGHQLPLVHIAANIEVFTAVLQQLRDNKRQSAYTTVVNW